MEIFSRLEVQARETNRTNIERYIAQMDAGLGDAKISTFRKLRNKKGLDGGAEWASKQGPVSQY